VAAAVTAAPSGASIAASDLAGFTVHHVPNPRYRPPTVVAQAIGLGTIGPLRAIDHLRFQVVQRGASDPAGFSEWQLFAGEQRRDRNAFEVSAAGEERFGRQELSTMALEARMGDIVAGLGDVPSVALGRLGSLQRLRGLSVASTSSSGISWRGMSGVPTPIVGQVTPRMGIAGGMAENLKVDGATTSLALFGFGRGRIATAQALVAGDTLAGGGGAATVDVRAPLPLGTLAFAVGAQLHDLDGSPGLAAQQGVGWSLGTPTLVLGFDDERATSRTRLLRTDGFALAPAHEDRWNAQARMMRGRVETHFTGVVRDGGDPSVAARTMQLGSSGGWGRTAWYSGADVYFTRHEVEGVNERRWSLYSGRLSSTGNALLVRFDRSADDHGRDAMQLSAEGAMALARGARLSVEPRMAWDGRRPQQANTDLRVTWPFQTLAIRLTALVTLGAAPEDGYRPAVREASLAMALAPRPRDHADVEVRRRDDAGAPTYETTASYDLSAQRYESLRGPRSSRDEGLVTIHVERDGDHIGVGDVLVMLDGSDSRFTDASGVARFEEVPPGTHLVSVEERSLPTAYQVTSSSRVFITVVRGQDTDPVIFQIARPVKVKQF
jgi:hypothetical protein